MSVKSSTLRTERASSRGQPAPATCIYASRPAGSAGGTSSQAEPPGAGRGTLGPLPGLDAFIALDWCGNQLVGIEILDASTILPASLLDQAEIIGQPGSGPGNSLATPLTVFADHGADGRGGPTGVTAAGWQRRLEYGR